MDNNVLVLATFNGGKLLEFQALLSPLNISLRSLGDCGVTEVPEETGRTFMENARIKARSALRLTGLPSLADDSGIIADALGNEPGVYSARYGAPGAKTDADRYACLLKRLEGEQNRAARFVCALCLCLPDGREFTAEGVCAGVIAHSPSGIGGFGYDPVFYLPECGMTMAELTDKNRVSHRHRAVASLMENLEKIEVFGGSQGAFCKKSVESPKANKGANLMTSKERAELRSKANSLEAVIHVGKGGVIDAVVAQADGVLRTRELVKGRVLETSPQSPKEVCEELCARTNAQPVQVVGRVFVFYRYNPELHTETQKKPAEKPSAPKRLSARAPARPASGASAGASPGARSGVKAGAKPGARKAPPRNRGGRDGQ